MPRITRLDPGTEMYLPFAKSRISALKATGLKYASQSFEVGGVTIKVRLSGEHEFIQTEGGSAQYEFFAADALYVANPFRPEGISGSPGTLGLVKPLNPTLSYMSGCGVRYSRAGGTPIFAMSLAPDEDDPKWAIRSYLDRATVAAGNARLTDEFTAIHAWADQNFQQHHWWKNNKPSYLVTSTGASGRGRAWTCFNEKWYTSGAVPSQDTGDGSYAVRRKVGDFAWYLYLTADDATPVPTYPRFRPFRAHEGPGLFDITPSAHTKTNSSWGGHKRSTQANWRHAAVQTVVAESGNRYDFMVSTDTHGGFTVYPVADYTREWASLLPGETVDSIPARLVKVATPDYPGWVTQTALNETTSPDHFQWAFNSTATRAATTPLNKAPAFANVAVGRKNTDIRIYSFMSRTGNATPTWMTGMNPSTVGGTDAYDTLTIERLEIRKKKTGAPSDKAPWVALADAFGKAQQQDYEFNDNFAFVVDGRLIPACLFSTEDTDFAVPAGLTLDPENYEPTDVTTPGFMEVGINITVAEPEGQPFTFEVAIEVLAQEEYATNKRFFMDVGYYVPTPRTAKKPGEPAKDTLLTGEIEVFWKPDDALEYALGAQTSSTGDARKAANNLRPPIYGVRPDGVNYDPTTPKFVPAPIEGFRTGVGVEGLLAGGYCGMHLYIYYTVRDRATQQIVKRLCLGHDVDWQAFELNWREHGRRRAWGENVVGSAGLQYAWSQDDSVPKTFFGMVEQAELRFLSFVTRSYCRKAVVDERLDYLSPENYLSFSTMLNPRFEVRIHGEEMETVDYSRPELRGYGAEFGADPMTELTEPPAGAVRLPHQPDSEGFALSMLQWVAYHQFDITHNDCFSFSPAGHWSVYFDRRAIGLPTDPSSTALSGVFDIIYDHKSKKRTSHKAAFNKAFGQARDYVFYDLTKGDIGGFAATGVWTPTN